MKTIKSKTIMLLIASLVMISSNMLAQRNQGKGQQKGQQKLECNIPNLTDDQQTKIDKLKVEHRKAMLQNRNLMAEKRARLNTLRTADKADMNEINKTIDDMTVLKAKMMKQREAHIQKVRSLLNDEQRVHFDSRPHGKHKGYGMHRGGMGNRGNKGQCYNR